MFGRAVRGCVKFGNIRAIPDDLEKLDDARIESGKYKKTKSAKEDLKWA